MAAEPEPDRGQLAIPATDHPVDIGGATIGPSVIPRIRQVKLIRPRRWRQQLVDKLGRTFVIECPYCLSLVADESAGDEHLWRMHASNSRNQAGGFDLVPWLTELQRQVDHLEEDLVEPPTFATGTDQRQEHEWRDRNRRRVHWRMGRRS